MRHIAIVIPGLDRIGGAEQQAILLAEGLLLRGWKVTIVAMSGNGGSSRSVLAAKGIGFVSFGMRKGLADPRGWIQFNRWLRTSKPDVVHAHLPHAAWFARWSRLAAPIRVLVDTLHSTSTGMTGRKFGYRISAWLTDCVTAVSRAVAGTHLTAKMVSAQKLVVLPNGVQIEGRQAGPTERMVFRQRAGLENKFLWLAAGRLEPVKDYPTMLRAMAGLPEPACLVIAGSGKLENELKELSKQLGVDRRVRFLGFEPNVSSWMRAADGFVLSSLWEGLPMGLLEAAACGLPAVATDAPGSREVLIPGETGLMAPVGDATALRQAMSQLMVTSPEKRAAMGQCACLRVTKGFGLGNVLDRWEELYESLLTLNKAEARWGQSRLKL